MGRAFIELDAVDMASAVLRRIGNNVTALGRRISSFGSRTMWQGLFANLATLLATNEFRQFDDVMRRVQAKSTGTAQQMGILRDMVKSLSVETGVATSQIGALMEQLAQGGFNYDEIAKMTSPIIDLSQAGGSGSPEDQALAAEAVTQAIRSFGLEAKDARGVADILTVALNDSNFALDDLITTMSYLGPTAKVFKGSIQEVIALSAVLRNLNVRAETAGTAIRNMYLQMSSSTGRNKFNELLTSMTGKTIEFVDASGNLRPLPALLKEIGAASAGLGSAQKGELFGELLGLRALVPALFLAEDGTKKLGSEFDRMMQSLADADGEAKRTADIIRNGLGGSLNRALAQLKLFLNEWGEAFAPALTGAAKYITKIAAVMSEWVRQNQRVVVGLTLALALIPPLGAAIMLFGYGIIVAGNAIIVLSALLSGFTAILGTVMGVLATPLALGFILALVAWLPVIVFGWKDMLAGIQSVIKTLSKFSFVKNLNTWFTELFGIIGSGFSKMGTDGKDAISAIVSAVEAGEIEIAMRMAVLGAQEAWGTLKDTALDVLDKILEKIAVVYNTWKAAGIALGETLDPDFTLSDEQTADDAMNSKQDALETKVQAELQDIAKIPESERTQAQKDKFDAYGGAYNMNHGAPVSEAGRDAYRKSLDEQAGGLMLEDRSAQAAERKKLLEEERKKIDEEMDLLKAKVEQSKKEAEERKLAEFQSNYKKEDDYYGAWDAMVKENQAAGITPGGGLPQGVAGIPLPPELLRGSQLGTFDAMSAFTQNRAGGKSVSELLEENNHELASHTDILESIEEKLSAEQVV